MCPREVSGPPTSLFIALHRSNFKLSEIHGRAMFDRHVGGEGWVNRRGGLGEYRAYDAQKCGVKTIFFESEVERERERERERGAPAGGAQRGGRQRWTSSGPPATQPPAVRGSGFRVQGGGLRV